MIFDGVVLAALLISCLIAFFRGFIREVLTILGVVGGGAAAAGFGPKLQPVVLHWLLRKQHGQDTTAAAVSANPGAHAEHGDNILGFLSPETAADLIAYGGLFVIVVIILSIFSHIVSAGAKKIGLGTADRTLGVLFGIARALILLALVYIPVNVMADEATQKAWFGDSVTRPTIRLMSVAMEGYLPKSITGDMNAKMNKDSATFANGTREKLEQLDLLGQQLKQKGEDADKSAQQKGMAAGGDIRVEGKEAGDKLKADAAELHKKMLEERKRLQQQKQDSGSTDNKTNAGYGSQQRGQMDGLIQQENQTGNANGQ